MPGPFEGIPVFDLDLKSTHDRATATWTPVSGRGKLLSWVTFRRQYFGEYPSGHVVVSLELEEGPLCITIPRELGDRALADDLEMELAWEESVDRFGEYNLPVFRPAHA
jgi:hypothetical protein